MPRTKYPIAPVLIVLLAVLLRLPFADTYIVWADEFSVALQGIRIAMEGERPLVGTEATFQGLSHHSPLTSYLAAVPFTLFPDPGMARIFVGLLGVLAVALGYAMIKRYLGYRAALLGAILLAVHPLLIHWSRFVWNPTLGLVFIPLWFFTGLLAYHDGRRWAQVLHWLVLSANIQSQAGLVYLLPVSAALALWHLLLHPRRWHTLIATAVGIACFVMSLIPWVIGLENQPGDPEAVESLPALNVAGLAQVPQIFGRIVGAVSFPNSELNWHENPSGLWDTLPLHTVGAGFAWIALIGMGWMALVWLRAPKAKMPQGFIAAMGFAPFAMILLAAPDQPITDHFFIPVTFAAISAAAYLLAQIRLRWPVVLLMLVLVVNYILLTASHLWWMHEHRYEHPNGNLTALSEQAEQFLQYGDVLLMLRERSLEPALPPLERFRTAELHWSWYLMSTRYPIYRADSPGDYLIVPGNQRVAIIGRSFSQLIPAWFGDSDLAGYADRYRILTLEPPAPAQQPNQYAGVAKLIGMYHDAALCAGAAAGITLIWQPLMTQPDTTYHFSLRLVDSAGHQQAQVDIPTLPSELWHSGEVVIARMALPAAGQEVAALQVVLYSVPDIVSVDVVDTQGSPANYFVNVPLDCGELD